MRSLTCYAWALVATVTLGASASGCSKGSATGAPDARPDGTQRAACASGKMTCGGACVEANSDPDNCGGCGIACEPGQVCANGTCSLYCAGGTAQCEGLCVNETNDPSNCGGCGVSCASGEVCALSQCVAYCTTGNTMCASGCVDESSDPANCGGCGIVCSSGEVCSHALCVGTCATGQTLCVPDAGGSYCATVESDNANCGTCGRSCGDVASCVGGVCTTLCTRGLTLCATVTQSDAGAPDAGIVGVCADLATDSANCGACRAPCGGTQTCAPDDAGLGKCTCPSALPNACGAGSLAFCASFTTDPSHCGGCDTACAEGQVCKGSCVTPSSVTTIAPQALDVPADCGTWPYVGAKAAIDDAGDLAIVTECGVVVSTDGGQTYATYAGPVDAAAPSTDMAIEGGPAHTFYLAGTSASGTWFATSSDAAMSWSPLTFLDTAAAAWGVSLAHYGNAVYVQTDRLDMTTGDDSIALFASASGGGGPFTATTPKESAGTTGPNYVVTDATGNVWSIGTSAGSFLFAESRSGGATFGSVTTYAASTSVYSVWSIGGGAIFAAGLSEATGATTGNLLSFPLAALTPPAVITGLPSPFGPTSAISADALGNVYVADQLPGGGIALAQVTAGATRVTTTRLLDPSGASPVVKALPGNGVLVAYMSGGQLVATVQGGF